MRSLQQLELEVSQLPIELRISLLQTLAASLTHSPQSNTDFKTALAAIPDLGEDTDFARITDQGRDLELSA